MTCQAIYVIPLVPFSYTESVNAVLVSEVIGLFGGPVRELVAYPINPSKQAFVSNVIQTDPGLGAIMSALDVDVLFLGFDHS